MCASEAVVPGGEAEEKSLVDQVLDDLKELPEHVTAAVIKTKSFLKKIIKKTQKESKYASSSFFYLIVDPYFDVAGSNIRDYLIAFGGSSDNGRIVVIPDEGHAEEIFEELKEKNGPLINGRRLRILLGCWLLNRIFWILARAKAVGFTLISRSMYLRAV